MPKKEDDPLLPSASTTANSSSQKIKDLFAMHSDGNMDKTMNFEVQPETLRFYAYVFFWTMGLVAILLTEFVVYDYLKAGPGPGEPACPPFQSGQGFDLHTDSHLIRVYGFNNVRPCGIWQKKLNLYCLVLFGFLCVIPSPNQCLHFELNMCLVFLTTLPTSNTGICHRNPQICSNWDYSPAREIVALIYPVFEYTLLLYLVADFVNTAISFHKGWVSRRYFRVARVLFPVMILLCSWFRMIFVILVYENARGHTAGFLGLQLTLMMVACLNVWYISETKIEYDFLGGLRGTRVCALTYLVCDLAVSATKFWLDVHVVVGYPYPSWGTTQVGDQVVGQIVDHIWMIFNAILPLIISYVRSRNERPLEVSVDLQAPKFILQRIRDQEEASTADA